MMKKIFLLTLLISTAVNVFGQDFPVSGGGGGLFGYSFTRYTLEGGGVKSYQNMDRLNYAGFLFFDVTYVEFSLLVQGGSGPYSEKMLFSSVSLSDDNGMGYETSLGFSIFGKYPFIINEKITLFPLFGLEYHTALIQRRQPEGGPVYDRTSGNLAADRDKDGDPYFISAWNSFWIDVGAGLDYNISELLFLRCELFFGFRLPTAYEMGELDLVRYQMNVDNPGFSGLTGGPSIKIGIGYRF